MRTCAVVGLAMPQWHFCTSMMRHIAFRELLVACAHQFPRVHDALRIEHTLHSAQDADAELTVLYGHPRRVLVTDGMLMADRPTVLHEALGCRLLDALPLLDFLAARHARQDGEIQRGAIPVNV